MIEIAAIEPARTRARQMIRPMLLLSILLLAGCGEPERPRFVPSTAASTADRNSSDKASGEVVIPKNIPMH
jgi:hypothetical protein